MVIYCISIFNDTGPNIASVKDFWRMVWQYNCEKIVMLTNLVEGEKVKLEGKNLY